MSRLRKISAALVILLAFTTLPLATAQDSIDNPNESTPTTLYFHIFDTINRFVINTQPMDSEFFDVGGANYPTTPDIGTGIPGTGLPINNGYDLNTIYGYSTAGPVEYDFIENGKPRFHPERGIAATVDLDASVTPVAYLYFDLRDAIGSDGLMTAQPFFTVSVKVQEGDDPGLDAKLDDGRDIMSGRMTVQAIDTDLQPGAKFLCDATCCEPGKEDIYTDCQALYLAFGGFRDSEPTKVDVPVDQALEGQSVGAQQFVIPDDNGIVQVIVPLTMHQDTIPKKEAYNVRLDWFTSDPADGAVIPDDQLSTGWLRLASDPEHLTRMEFNVMNPIYFSFIHPQVAGGSLLIHAGGNSPWGTYDVNLEEVEIEVIHESGTKVPDNQLKKLLNSNEHVHGLHDEDAQMTFLWDFRDNEAEVGEYTIKMKITNDAVDDNGDYAASATAQGEAKFIISETEAIGLDTSGKIVEATSTLDSGEVESPGVGAFGAMALLGAALIIARRRSFE
jgi:hypothetical protein